MWSWRDWPCVSLIVASTSLGLPREIVATRQDPIKAAPTCCLIGYYWPLFTVCIFPSSLLCKPRSFHASFMLSFFRKDPCVVLGVMATWGSFLGHPSCSSLGRRDQPSQGIVSSLTLPKDFPPERCLPSIKAPTHLNSAWDKFHIQMALDRSIVQGSHWIVGVKELKQCFSVTQGLVSSVTKYQIMQVILWEERSVCFP